MAIIVKLKVDDLESWFRETTCGFCVGFSVAAAFRNQVKMSDKMAGLSANHGVF